MATNAWLLAAVLLSAAAPAYSTGPGEENLGPATFDLNEVSVFDAQAGGYFVRGQSVQCTGDPCSVVTYPILASKNPLYGSVRLPRTDNLDQSGRETCFALDESKGTGTGYDRLFFDGNHDGNLADDPPLTAVSPSPGKSLLDDRYIVQQVVFSSLAVTLEGGPRGPLGLELLPRLEVWDRGFKYLSLVPAKAHTGQIRIGDRAFQAYLGYFFVSGWLDGPMTGMYLVPRGPGEEFNPWWLWSNRLMAIHRIGDRYWQFSATPAGDKLTVSPYRKALGTLEIRPRARYLREAAISGALRSRDGVVAIGKQPNGGPEPGQTCELPEGDYQPISLFARCGPLSMYIDANYFSDGTGWNRRRPETYALQIRKDRPFVLDFAARPEVLFASPARATRVKRGETLTVLALLVDPKLNLMICEFRSVHHARISVVHTVLAPILFIAGLVLLVTPRIPKARRRIGWVPLAASLLILCWLGFNGLLDDWMAKTYTPRPEKLEAAAVITRADGRIAAQGDLPLSWKIPQDFDLRADEETFTATVTYETQELYGTVKATRQVTICR